MLVVNAQYPERAVLQQATAILRQGGVVAYPTDTVYGLAVDALNEKAIARLYAVKQRPLVKALPVIIGALEQLRSVVSRVPVRAVRLIEVFWPGPLTLLLPPHHCVPQLLLGGRRCIGVRLPESTLRRGLALTYGGAITASSANRSGLPAATTASEVIAQLGAWIDLVLDGGPATSSEVSTILDVTVDPPHLLRKGKIRGQDIEAVLGCPLVCQDETGLGGDSRERDRRVDSSTKDAYILG